MPLGCGTHIVGVPREHNNLRYNTVVGGVAGILGATTRAVIDFATDGGTQGVNDFAAVVQ